MSGNELAGVKVADFSAIMSGPYCTRLMASLGADVVKIEPPNGEHLRTTPPLRAGNSVYFGMLNAGKKSVVIDLRNPEGRRAAEGIIAWADVLIENFRPGVMRKFGLDYESVAQRYPRIVYCSISGYGQDGPWVDRPAVAQVVHAVSGYDMALLHAQGQLDAPLATGPFIADAMAGALAFGGILAGLRARDHTGEGRYVDLSLVDGMLSMMPGELSAAQFPELFHRRNYPAYRTSDGYIMIAAVNQRNFEGLARAMGQPELIDDPRFRTNPLRWEHSEELTKVIAAWAATRTAEECEQAMLAAGTPAARYRQVEESFDNEQLQARGTFIEAEDRAGVFRIVASPYRLRGIVDSPTACGPEFPVRVPSPGEHTREVLTRILGEDDASRVIESGGASAPEDDQ